MKFAKELEQELVPEWRIKYLNYKGGKKYIKAVRTAVRKANTTPTLQRRSGDLPPHATPRFARRPTFSGTDASGRTPGLERTQSAALRRVSTTPASRAATQPHGSSTIAAQPIPGRKGESQRLADSPGHDLQYGSFVATPPSAGAVGGPVAIDFQLPGPAMERIPSYLQHEPSAHKTPGLRNPFSRAASDGPKGLGVIHSAAQSSTHSPANGSPTQSHSPAAQGNGRHALFLETNDGDGSPIAGPSGTPKQRLKRLFSHPSPMVGRRPTLRPGTVNTNQDEIRQRESDFFTFLDSELDKVETFYREKEDQAARRLITLREQLHVMRNRRTQELADARLQRRETALGHEHGNGNGNGNGNGGGGGGGGGEGDSAENSNGKGGGSAKTSSRNDWMGPAARAKLFSRRPGPNSKALQQMPQTPHLKGAAVAAADGRRDYARRPAADQDVPYRTAKRKLKLALQEFYRGLELLKAYAMLNRTAFRKLNKKYDKAVNARPQYRYMYERVAPSYFVRSTLLDDHIAAVEDLYARYFERGNHKLAAGKLRSLSRKAGDESGSSFRSGLLIGVGAVFTVQGLTYGSERLFNEDPSVAREASYLMQVYGGYFLMLYLFVLFCLDCRLWTRNKINYQFIFELDPRSQLDWRQLSQFPAFFLLVFGVLFWINFSRLGSDDMYLYFPVVLIGVTLLILFFPAPVFFYRSRRWFLYSHWRLLLAGLYPVEFRDFFLGDIYCSLTYAMCNIELFFCLYRNAWLDPEQCNSSHSRLLGFLSALPPIWRFLQCIRRYHDTGNVFPHLVNCGKYLMSIIAAMCLSLYRIDGTRTNLALFITFSTINGIYTSIWDIFMDFSLLQPSPHNFLLRDITGLKSKWPYYGIMVADPILRFIWIFYAIFTHDAQHSTIMSFMVAFAEVTRRGMWTIFRVENEHCSNVAQYKASRDVPLPYRLGDDETQKQQQQQQPSTPPRSDRDDQRGLLDRDDGSPGATTATGARTPASAPATATGVNMGGLGIGGGKQGEAPQTGARTPGPTSQGQQQKEKQKQKQEASPPAAAAATPADAEEGRAGGEAAAATTEAQADGAGAGVATGIRRRLTRSGTLVGGLSRILAEAHKQDFEKKRRPAASSPGAAIPDEEDDDDDEDDEDEVRYRNLHSGRAPDDTDEEGEDDDEDDDAGCFSNDEAEDEHEYRGGGGGGDPSPAAGASAPVSAPGVEMELQEQGAGGRKS
ncbi:hypothetical protein RB593_008972 [Gaeumannomyces tritici]